eukprot:5843472-Amphidinium_carterae.1
MRPTRCSPSLPLERERDDVMTRLKKRLIIVSRVCHTYMEGMRPHRDAATAAAADHAEEEDRSLGAIRHLHPTIFQGSNSNTAQTVLKSTLALITGPLESVPQSCKLVTPSFRSYVDYCKNASQKFALPKRIKHRSLRVQLHAFSCSCLKMYEAYI